MVLAAYFAASRINVAPAVVLSVHGICLKRIAEKVRKNFEWRARRLAGRTCAAPRGPRPPDTEMSGAGAPGSPGSRG